MQLALSTWEEVEDYLAHSRTIVIPTGSTEQHGPIGVIGTDAFCAEAIAVAAGKRAGILVAPVVGYTPAAFNLAFPGTMSVSVETFSALVGDLVDGLAGQGFQKFYFLNGHGANVAPLKNMAEHRRERVICVRSWWDFGPVDTLRRAFFGDWEGMHATPSEVAITQHLHRIVEYDDLPPPEKLSADYIRAHAGDRHGAPDEHRARFPDGRVGSHSALATPERGRQLFDAAVEAAAADLLRFTDS